MKINDLISSLEKELSLSFQEEWDHSGLQLGNLNNELKKVLVTLNVDEDTIDEAIKHECNLIISHHPFLFHSFKTIDTSMIFGQNIEKLIKNDISVYSMHTNYDKLRMNKVLLNKIGCINLVQNEYVCFGTLKEEMNFDTFISHIKKTFCLPYVRVCGKSIEKVSRISICGGSGHDFIDEALNLSDVYITGDLSYSNAMDIILKEKGTVLDVTHFIESIFKEDMKLLIKDKENIDVILSNEKDYFTTY